MVRNRLTTAALALGSALALAGFKEAKVEVPAALAAAAPMEVSGHRVRTLNKPMAFGAYRVTGVREGAEFSWSTEAFGVRGGSARQRYRFVLEGPEGEAREVECRSRSIEAWRGGWTVELTEAFSPRLACGLRSEGKLLRLVLGSRAGAELRGALVGSEGEAPLLAVRSLHRLEGSRLPLGAPAGYALERDGAAVAAVETLNRGRIWLAPDLDEPTRGTAAAAAAALLLYDPELTPQVE